MANINVSLYYYHLIYLGNNTFWKLQSCLPALKSFVFGQVRGIPNYITNLSTLEYHCFSDKRHII